MEFFLHLDSIPSLGAGLAFGAILGKFYLIRIQICKQNKINNNSVDRLWSPFKFTITTKTAISIGFVHLIGFSEINGKNN